MRIRAIVLYCVLVYALGWTFQLAAIELAGNLDSAAALPWLGAAMFTPGLVALGFAVFHAPARKGLLFRPTWRMVPLMLPAFLIPTLIAFAGVAICEILGWGHAGWFAFGRDSVSISGGPWLLGKGSQTWPVFAANVIATGAAYSGINGLAAVGEEFGWRAFLQGQLIARLGIGGGIFLLGLLWAFWHLPLLLAGYNYPEHPLLGAVVLFPLTLVGASFFLGWLTLRARTFWPAAIAHGATNSIEEGVLGNIHLGVSHLHLDILRVVLTVLVGLICWILLTRNTARAGDVPVRP
jgi:membrane protease YdiL (CAAX protease family)